MKRNDLEEDPQDVAELNKTSTGRAPSVTGCGHKPFAHSTMMLMFTCFVVTKLSIRGRH